MDAVSTPRELTPEICRKLGFVRAPDRSHAWRNAVILVLVFGAPLSVAGYVGYAALLALSVLLGVLGWQMFERDLAASGEKLYCTGDEAIARVLWVEPPGQGRRDHLACIEYSARGSAITAKSTGAPLARQGLRPGDQIRVIYDPERPKRCLLIERATPEDRERLGAPPAPCKDDDGCGGDCQCAEGGCGDACKCAGGKKSGGGCGGGGCGGGGCGGGHHG